MIGSYLRVTKSIPEDFKREFTNMKLDKIYESTSLTIRTKNFGILEEKENQFHRKNIL